MRRLSRPARTILIRVRGDDDSDSELAYDTASRKPLIEIARLAPELESWAGGGIDLTLVRQLPARLEMRVGD